MIRLGRSIFALLQDLDPKFPFQGLYYLTLQNKGFFLLLIAHGIVLSLSGFHSGPILRHETIDVKYKFCNGRG